MLYNDLRKNNFYCIHAEQESGVFEYLKDNLAIRFAKNGTMIPNIEILMHCSLILCILPYNFLYIPILHNFLMQRVINYH
jgi:hypothetical protein